MKRAINKSSKIIIGLMVLFLSLGCKKESPCNKVVQGDFVLVE